MSGARLARRRVRALGLSAARLALLATVACSGSAVAAAGGPGFVRIPAKLVVFDAVVVSAGSNRCVEIRGIEFPAVAGATSYTVTVKDNLHYITGGTIDPSQLGPPISSDALAKLLGRNARLTGGEIYFQIGGGAYEAPCVPPGASENGRFTNPRAFALVANPPKTATIEGTVTGASGRPLKGVTLKASGPSSRTATSGASGGYRMTVSPGRYSVVPAASSSGKAATFKPPSLTLTVARGSTATADFTLQLATLGIDWSMPKRLTLQTPAQQSWGALDGLPPVAEIYPKSWQVNLFLTDGGVPSCPSGTTYLWSVSGRGTTQTLPGRSCKVLATVPKLGTYSVTAKEFKNSQPTGTAASNPKVEVQDFLIVGLGDSNGSGEGNWPFYYDRCNRSVASYQYQAALYVQDQDPHASVTFIHASCSGASVDHLTTSKYAGIRPESPPLQPQIQQVTTLLDHQKPVRPVDAVIVSVGVNDLGFGAILEFCALGPSNCEKARVTPAVDETNHITAFTASSSPTDPTLATEIANLQKQLPARYGPLAADLTRPVSAAGGLGAAPKDVLITQYPDFTNGDNGTPCGPTGAARFTTATWAWLGQNAKLLNSTVAAAAKAHGWTLVPVNSAAFATRGYCSTRSLFVGIANAKAHGDAGGPFHPDAEAHQIQAAEVEPLLCKQLGLSPTCQSD